MNGQNFPTGFSPSNTITSASWTEKQQEFFINPASAVSIFKGDLIVVDSTAKGYVTSFPYSAPNATNAQTAAILGFFNGCEYVPAGSQTGGSAVVFSDWFPQGTAVMPGTLIKASVITDYNTLADGQINNTELQPIGPQALPFRNAQIARSAGFSTANPWGGNVAMGTSGMMIDFLTIGSSTAATCPIKLLKPTQEIKNLLSSYTTAQIMINNSAFRPGTVGLST